MFAGTGIGGAVSPLLISSLLDSVGFHWTLRIWSAIVAVSIGTALIFCKPRIPPRAMKGQTRPPFMPVSWEFGRNPVFWLFVSIVLGHIFSWLIFTAYRLLLLITDDEALNSDNAIFPSSLERPSEVL